MNILIEIVVLCVGMSISYLARKRMNIYRSFSRSKRLGEVRQGISCFERILRSAGVMLFTSRIEGVSSLNRALGTHARQEFHVQIQFDR